MPTMCVGLGHMHACGVRVLQQMRCTRVHESTSPRVHELGVSCNVTNVYGAVERVRGQHRCVRVHLRRMRQSLPAPRVVVWLPWAAPDDTVSDSTTSTTSVYLVHARQCATMMCMIGWLRWSSIWRPAGSGAEWLACGGHRTAPSCSVFIPQCKRGPTRVSVCVCLRSSRRHV